MARTDPEPQRVALVTGGAVRVGRAIALGLARAGYDLAVTYHASRKPALEVEREVRASGRRCELVQADLSDPAAADSVVGSVQRAYGHLDLLVNSAASFDARPLLEVDAEAWDAVMDLNARAPHLLVRAAAQMLRASRGNVVNITDLAAFQAWTERPQHAVSKAALAHLTRIQARVLAPEVRVNAVAPGAVLPPGDFSEERRQALAEATPLKRLGTVEDIGNAAAFLASKEAGYITGQSIIVDGGQIVPESLEALASA